MVVRMPTSNACSLYSNHSQIQHARQEDINAIKEAIKRMGTIHQEAFLATTGPKEQKLSSELNNVIQETNPKAQSAKAMLSVSFRVAWSNVCI